MSEKSNASSGGIGVWQCDGCGQHYKNLTNNKSMSLTEQSLRARILELEGHRKQWRNIAARLMDAVYTYVKANSTLTMAGRKCSKPSIQALADALDLSRTEESELSSSADQKGT